MWLIWVRLEIGEKKEKRHQNLFACLSGALVSPLQLCSKSRALFVICRQLDFAHGMQKSKQSSNAVWGNKSPYIFSIQIQSDPVVISAMVTKICIARDGQPFRLFTSPTIFETRRDLSEAIEK